MKFIITKGKKGYCLEPFEVNRHLTTAPDEEIVYFSSFWELTSHLGEIFEPPKPTQEPLPFAEKQEFLDEYLGTI